MYRWKKITSTFISLLAMICIFTQFGCGDSIADTDNSITDEPSIDVSQANPTLAETLTEQDLVSIDTTQSYENQESQVAVFQKAGCLPIQNGIRTFDESCLHRYNYRTHYKPLAPAPNNVSDIQCTKSNGTIINVVINTYNQTPGQSLLCDIINQTENKMLFFSRNTRNYCSRAWNNYKKQQNYQCSDDPASVREVNGSPSTTPSVDVSEDDQTNTVYYTVTNKLDVSVSITSSQSPSTVVLNQNECAFVQESDFSKLSIIHTDINSNNLSLCSPESNVCSAGNYEVKRRFFSRAYYLDSSSQNSNCVYFSL